MNLIFWSTDNGNDPEDREAATWLAPVDPGRGDATYWMRFHRSALEAARFELARRRREAELTVVGVVSSWSRALLPAALTAAAAAGLLLVRPAGQDLEALVPVEEVLNMGLAHPIPAEEDGDLAENVLLASEIY